MEGRFIMEEFILEIHKRFENVDLKTLMSAKNKQAPETEKRFPTELKRIPLRVNEKKLADLTLYDILRKRESKRDYTKKEISFESLSNIIYYSYGIKQYRDYAYNRKDYPVSYSPAAGGLNPFNIYIYIKKVTDIKDGLYYYSPKENCLVELYTGLTEIDLSENYSTEFPIHANINIFIVTDIERFIWKYGERGYRFSNIDCGILSENITLLSTYLGLGSCMVAAYVNDSVVKNLNLNKTEIPLLGISIGGIPDE